MSGKSFWGQYEKNGMFFFVENLCDSVIERRLIKAHSSD